MKPIYAALALGAVLLAGCSVHGRTGARVYAEPPVGTVTITSAPLYYDAYPHTYYDGRVVYYVDGRWGYPAGSGRWTYYQQEPPPLVRYRTTIQSAPPAAPRYTSPPPRSAPPQSAPPATRTR